jgi:hypothetical protein
MPPEQAAGRHGDVSPASDVYGLGALLYELLTGRPPFRGENRLATLRQVLEAEPVAPRLLNPGVPRDLETVCLKCLQKEPAKRYPSAGALADDLARFLDGRPILARPVRRAERLVHWCRRNPVPAALWAALAVSIVAGFSLVLWQWLRAERSAEVARTERDTADRERQKAEAHLAQARDAVDFIGRQIGHVQLGLAPHSEKIRREMMEYALRFHEGYLHEYGADPVFRTDAAKAFVRVSDLRARLGDSEGAAAAILRAIELFESLTADRPDHGHYWKELTSAWITLGSVRASQARLHEAGEAYRRAEATLDTAPEQARSEPSYHCKSSWWRNSRRIRATSRHVLPRTTRWPSPSSVPDGRPRPCRCTGRHWTSRNGWRPVTRSTRAAGRSLGHRLGTSPYSTASTGQATAPWRCTAGRRPCSNAWRPTSRTRRSTTTN